jgi:uncharacterized phage-associated protein
MAHVDDVAAAIVKQLGPIDTWKLQKLVYYCQAWHLVWERRPLFTNKIEAWANGPVVPNLYKQHRGRFSVKAWESGDAARLKNAENSTIKAVLNFYGKRPGYVLAALTHRERPWQDGRAGLAAGERGNSEITPDAMLAYYEGLVS